MKIDCSEMKEFRKCQRKWQFSSRNQFHLRPFVTPKAFKIGTVFHNALHKLYVGKELPEITEYIDQQMQDSDPKDLTMLHNMINGYANEQMPSDQEQFVTLDIEHQFTIKPLELLELFGIDPVEMGLANELLEDVEIVGSIDMVSLNTETNEIWGFEHKTAKNFRDDTYLWLDEQPRIYYLALMPYVQKYNAKLKKDYQDAWGEINAFPIAARHESEYPSKPNYVTLGGVYINEVRKLIRSFEIKRSALKYREDDLRNFVISMFSTIAACHKRVNNKNIPAVPQPDFMACGMCNYATMCQTYQYQDIDLKELLAEFSQEFHVREQDHLADKEDVV